MIRSLPLGLAALCLGIATASFIPQIPQTLRLAVGVSDASEAPPDRAAARLAEDADKVPTLIRFDQAQIETAGIALAPVQDGTLARRILVPGTIVPHADRVARVSVRLSATVAELRKRFGDTVAKDEVMAVLESRDLAAAKSEYLAARLNNALNKELYERDKELWDRRIIAEQVVLRSRHAAAQAKMNQDIARQKLFALGVAEWEILALPDEPETSLRRQEIRAPISGRVVDRKVDLGAVVGRDNLETELFTIVDLDRVWVDLAVSPTDLPAVGEGQAVSVAAHGLAYRAAGKIVFIGPMLERETHSARVVAEIPNPDGNWRPGSLVRCTITIEERRVPLTVPASAVQTIGASPVVFVRTPDGFEKRPVTLGQSDDRISEVLAGLRAGEAVAVTNTFALKAEFLKALAED